MEYYALVPLGFQGGGPQAICGKIGDCGKKIWGLEFMMPLQLSGEKCGTNCF